VKQWVDHQLSTMCHVQTTETRRCIVCLLFPELMVSGYRIPY
jgi:hypothetical protein